MSETPTPGPNRRAADAGSRRGRLARFRQPLFRRTLPQHCFIQHYFLLFHLALSTGAGAMPSLTA